MIIKLQRKQEGKNIQFLNKLNSVYPFNFWRS